MLQNKNYQQQQKLPEQPTKTNATKQELPTTTIKKPIVENQTSGKTKTNATKQELPTTDYQQQQKLMLQNKNYQQQQSYQ